MLDKIIKMFFEKEKKTKTITVLRKNLTASELNQKSYEYLMNRGKFYSAIFSANIQV